MGATDILQKTCAKLWSSEFICRCYCAYPTVFDLKLEVGRAPRHNCTSILHGQNRVRPCKGLPQDRHRFDDRARSRDQKPWLLVDSGPRGCNTTGPPTLPFHN